MIKLDLHQREVLEIINAYSPLNPSDSEKLFLRKIDNETILETLIKMNLNFVSAIFDKEESLKIILKYKRYDLLKFVTPRNFLRYKRKNMTYLEYILRVHEYHPEINISFYDPFNKKCSLKDVADFYITYAKHNLEKNLPTLTDERLKYRDKDLMSKLFNGNDNFLAIMLKRSNDKDFIVDKFISNKETKDLEIMLTLEEYDKYKAKLEIKDYSSSLYLDSYYRDYLDKYYELDIDDQLLLDKLRGLLERTSSKQAVEIVICSYIESLYYKNNPLIYKEIEKFINILEKDKDFKVKMGDDTHYNISKEEIMLSDRIVPSFNHELGHMFLDKLCENLDTTEFDKIIDKIKKDPKTIEKISVMSNVFIQLRKLVYINAKKHFEETCDLDDKVIMRHLNNNKEKVIEKYTNMGYSKKTVQQIVDREYNKEEYLLQYVETQISGLNRTFNRVKINPMMCLSDMIDAIYDGDYLSNNLKDKNGNVLRSIGGHGTFYYKSRSGNRFDEIFANYMAIKKCVDTEWLKIDGIESPMDIIREVFGDEFVNYLDNFYEQKIINSRKYSKGEMVR